ncbi:Phage phiEco32-like COOH.NH2 ligase-type 2 [Evansella caseinilytica]|uniref:Phage phiEco32-like COOH.NH2 ligase-type 2 n=1 Tax=Evansella caseinilytica TaxID=1503961 RepID=A0A1H3LWX2_9BACI|nr:hypothetical protein [Evansella caseinilytica]SDY68910.1 Phage phiEco32-like COOH.NH2 ligase-type 2 [Evansella caseinilytica]
MNRHLIRQHRLTITSDKKASFFLIVTGKEFSPQTISAATAQGNIRQLASLDEVRRYYLGQEMVDLALQAAYYTRTPRYRVIVQRTGKALSIRSVASAGKAARGQAQQPVAANTPGVSLLGADIEVMVRKRDGGAFTALPMADHHDKVIGADSALIRKKHRFYQPIIELRAKPQKNGEKLRQEFLRLKTQLEKRAEKNGVVIVSEENPRGRFFLGGHVHISNANASFRKVSQLDAFVAVPLSAYKKNASLLRRAAYGKLGAVRLNRYRGFEYRTLPTWYAFIEEGAPFFNWLETVLYHPSLPEIQLAEEAVRAYYAGDRRQLCRETEKLFADVAPLLTVREKHCLLKWDRWLQQIGTIDENGSDPVL